MNEIILPILFCKLLFNITKNFGCLSMAVIKFQLILVDSHNNSFHGCFLKIMKYYFKHMEYYRK